MANEYCDRGFLILGKSNVFFFHRQQINISLVLEENSKSIVKDARKYVSLLKTLVVSFAVLNTNTIKSIPGQVELSANNPMTCKKH